MAKLCIESILSKTSSIEGWLSDEVAELLIKFARNSSVIVEVGSWKGKSTINMALANSKAKIYAIDPFTGSQEHQHLADHDIDTFKAFLKNCRDFNVDGQITPLRMNSDEAVSQIEEEIDLLFIDGSHEYPDVKADFENLFPKLKSGGVIAFHDSKWSGVKKVLWEDFFPNKNISGIQRIEDTSFARKLKIGKAKHRETNRAYLELEKSKQKMKNLKRRLKRLGTRLGHKGSLE
ncbi:MAG: hypothetical protein CME65_08630 [Halobacteriovoraceae bacterium]|nr:hypothetical protein [Halobacteriovoraceae bacterium]|tara:strand:- start:4234 stop:4935 length:702 start_codon:yes stop_codon:yes gene_type:complete